MDDRNFMKLAIREAKRSGEPLKCGAVIVKDGELLVKSSNYQRKRLDPTAHAEINAIRLAGKKIGSKYLHGCIVYATCEPCTMCISALILAQIEKLYFAVPLDKLVWKKRIRVSTESVLQNSEYKFEIISSFMEEECFKQLYSIK